MTAGDIVRLLWRRWYLVLLGAALTLVAIHQVVHRPGVWWTGYDVVALAPTETYYPNKLENPRYSIPPVVGVVVREWNGPRSEPLTASSETTLFGEGDRDATSVRMVMAGSQFNPLFPVPVLQIQVVGPTPDAVAQRSAVVRAQVDALLQERQRAAYVPASDRIVALTSPAQPSVTYHAGSPARAALATGLLGMAGTGLAVFWLERLLVWRRARRADG